MQKHMINQLFMSFLLPHWPDNSLFPGALTFLCREQITASIICLKFTHHTNIYSICLQCEMSLPSASIGMIHSSKSSRFPCYTRFRVHPRPRKMVPSRQDIPVPCSHQAFWRTQIIFLENRELTGRIFCQKYIWYYSPSFPGFPKWKIPSCGALHEVSLVYPKYCLPLHTPEPDGEWHPTGNSKTERRARWGL